MIARSSLWSKSVSWLGKQALCICIIAMILVDCAEREEKKATEQGRLLGSLFNSLTGYTNNYNGNTNNYNGYSGFNGFNYNNNYYNNHNNYNNCPLCDVTVMSYCGDRLLHDACCCLPPNELPRQCEYADCSFLHANSCREHALITRCCCARKNARILNIKI